MNYGLRTSCFLSILVTWQCKVFINNGTIPVVIYLQLLQLVVCALFIVRHTDELDEPDIDSEIGMFVFL